MPFASTFISTYKRETSKISAPGARKPVIIVYDNDSGAKSIRSVIKQVSGKTVRERVLFTLSGTYMLCQRPSSMAHNLQRSKISLRRLLKLL